MRRRCLVLASLAVAGCSTHLAPLVDAPVPVDTVPESAGPPVSLLVCRFDDLRGDRLATPSAIGMVPGLNLFYTGNTVHYADRGGFANTSIQRPEIRNGNLATDLPDLLAASIRSVRPNWSIEVTASPERCRDGGDASFVIAGAIRRTDLHMRLNIVPLGALALLGTPLSFVQFDGELDVEIRRADTGAIAWRHGFQIDERKAVGFYYNRTAPYAMFAALVKETVAHSAASAIHLAERGA